MAAETLQGLVCSLERFATHDGPGIRTVVFMKGCGMNCQWCSSPHTRRKQPELLFHAGRCRRTGACLTLCPEQALRVADGDVMVIDRKRCSGCGLCVTACPTRALEIVGSAMTVEQLFQEVDKDSAYYRRSNGGVTVSGGELTVQSRFVTAFLRRCKDRHIHTAIETCGLASWNDLASVLAHVDLLFFDLKHMDDAAHRHITGAGNAQILANARQASHAVADMVLRVPVIPGLNDADENLIATARFARELGPAFRRLELLPYHKLGLHRYEQLGLSYELAGLEPPSDAQMAHLRALVQAEGVVVDTAS